MAETARVMVKTRAEAAPPCAEGSQQECTVPLPTQNDVHNCVVGKQLCVDGAFGPCVDLDTEWGPEWASSDAE
jgi:hypothetical protein